MTNVRIYIIIPIQNPTFNTTLVITPIKDPNPAFKLLFISFLANTYSPRVAPRNEPMNIPGIFAIKAPIKTPSIAPIIPYLLPPNFLAPNATTMLSIKVDSKERTKRTINMIGVIIKNLPIRANMNTEIYTNHTPGSAKKVSITPVRASIITITYRIISNISFLIINLIH